MISRDRDNRLDRWYSGELDTIGNVGAYNAERWETYPYKESYAGHDGSDVALVYGVSDVYLSGIWVKAGMLRQWLPGGVQQTGDVHAVPCKQQVGKHPLRELRHISSPISSREPIGSLASRLN